MASISVTERGLRRGVCGRVGVGGLSVIYFTGGHIMEQLQLKIKK